MEQYGPTLNACRLETDTFDSTAHRKRDTAQ